MSNSYKLLKQAKEYCLQKKYSHALTTINKAIKLDPRWPPLYQAKTKILLKMNKYGDALSTISDLIRIDPNAPKNWLTKAEIFMDGNIYPLEEVIIATREALLEAKRNIYNDDDESWKRLEIFSKKLYQMSHEITDKEMGKRPPPPRLRCPKCGEEKSDSYSFCLECGSVFAN